MTKRQWWWSRDELHAEWETSAEQNELNDSRGREDSVPNRGLIFGNMSEGPSSSPLSPPLPPVPREAHCQIAKSRISLSTPAALFINVVQTNTERCLASVDCHPPNNVTLYRWYYIVFCNLVLHQRGRRVCEGEQRSLCQAKTRPRSRFVSTRQNLSIN